MSCPYIKFNYEIMNEKCKVTDKPTGGAVKCDFGYDEECEHYKRQVQANNKKVVNTK